MKHLITISSLFSVAFVLVTFAIAINNLASWIILGIGGVVLPVWYEMIKGYVVPDKKEDKD